MRFGGIVASEIPAVWEEIASPRAVLRYTSPLESEQGAGWLGGTKRTGPRCGARIEQQGMNEHAADQVTEPPRTPSDPDPSGADGQTPSSPPGEAAAAPPSSEEPVTVPPKKPEAMEQPSPQPSPQPAAPESSVTLDAETEAEIDAAMAAMGTEAGAPGADSSAPQEAASAPSAAGGAAHHELPRPEELEAANAALEKKAIRGPRVVQGGREHRTGIVVSVGPTDIFVEFGPKELGVLPRDQFKEGDALPETTKEIEVVIDRFEASESLYICSRPGAVQKADWELLQPGQVVEARVTGFNKGGLELEVAKHRAFMPASQIDTRRIEDLSVFVGEKMPCKVIRVDRSGRGNITLSRRDLVAAERKAALEELKSKLEVGQTLEGVVKKIMPFGAFVDMGGMDGLLHISDLSHDRVNKVEDVVKEGQTVTVQILKLDWDKGRHSLGMKQLQEDPWQTATGDIKEGEEVSGTVTKMMEFGAFVEVASGIEGLVHISELSWQRVAKTSDVVQPGKVVKVKVLKVDPDTKKISLSMKQCSDAPRPKGTQKRGRGRGDRGDRDTRSADEILKETPALRRAREKAKQKEKDAAGLKSGLGDLGASGGGGGLGDLKLPG